MKALIAGSTGLIGKQLLDLLLKDEYYNEIEIIVRKKSVYNNPKLKETVIDFSNSIYYNNLKADHFFCCLGTTIKAAKTKEEFRKVDFEYAFKLAKSAEKNGAKSFTILSSIGANKDSGNFYLRTKGEMEMAIKELKIPLITILQPSLLLGNRTESRPGEMLFKYFMSISKIFLIGSLKKYRSIRDITVAKAMLKSAKSENKGCYTITYDKIEEIGGV